MRFLIALLLCVAGAPAVAGDDWSPRERALFGASTALLVADWAQTRYVARRPERFFERNPVLGAHPSRGRVDLYFGTALLANYLITDWLGHEGRLRFQAIVIGVEAGAVITNYSAGIRFDF